MPHYELLINSESEGHNTDLKQLLPIIQDYIETKVSHYASPNITLIIGDSKLQLNDYGFFTDNKNSMYVGQIYHSTRYKVNRDLILPNLSAVKSYLLSLVDINECKQVIALGTNFVKYYKVIQRDGQLSLRADGLPHEDINIIQL